MKARDVREVAFLQASPEGRDAGRHLYAIERHYDVLQILRAPWSDLEASEVLDVPAAGRGSRVNYEGLALHEGRLILLSDNQGATVDGPTVLLSIDRL